MIEMEGQPSFTCDIDVFGSVGSIGADGVGEIGLAELVNRLRSDGIQSTAVKKVVSGYCNVGLLMDDSRSSIHFLHLEPKFGFLAESLKAARLVDLKFHRKHLLGLTTDGRVVGGGSNQFGQLGIGTIPGPSMNNLAIVPKLVNVICIATGESHSAACTADGNIYTWGSSFYGQCSGSRAIHLTPSSVHGIPPMCSVVCGAYFTLAVSATGYPGAHGASAVDPNSVCVSGGDVYGWGDNTSSQLGLGQFATCIRRPCRIPLPHSVVKLSCGYGHAAALGSDGMLVVWGLNSSGQIGIQGTSCGKTPSVLDVDPDLINKNHVVDVLCGPNFTALLDTSGRVFTFGSDTPKGRLGRPKGGGRLEPGRIQRIDEKKVHRITECSSALLCQTATTISRVDISTVCASGGTLITIYGYAIANIKGFAWIKFCYKPYVDLIIEVDYANNPDLGQHCIQVVSPCLTQSVPGEVFPIHKLAISISVDGIYYSEPSYLSVFRPIPALDRTEYQCGPVSGDTPVVLSVEVDDIPYPNLQVRLVPVDAGNSNLIKQIGATYNSKDKHIVFNTPEVDCSASYRYSIALDGNCFIEYPEPVFIYYDALISSISPLQFCYGGGTLVISMLGLSNASLENFTRTQTKCILTSQSSRTRYELIGTTQVDNDKSLRHMTLVCPAIGPLLSDSESIPSREVMSVDVSFNGYNMMRCGEIEFFPPCMTRIAPTCGPKGRPTSIEVFGEYFYNEMSKSICVSDTDRLIISANYRDQTKSLQFNRPDIPLAAASPPSSVISISFGDKSLPYMLYDEPTSMKIEPNSGSALGGYVVKINGKGLFSSTSLSIRITAIGGATLPGKVYVVPGTLTAEPNAKTGLGTVSFTMAAMENGEKSGSIEISFNEVDYTSCSEQPFIFK